VRWLASGLPGAHIEGPIRPENKDDLTNLISTWIWEVAELGSTTRRSDREALKHFLTTERVTIRAPYGRHAMTKPALASFIGTVNSEGGGILDDPTGNRRFMVVELESIDWDYAQVEVNQVWAEAYAAYQAGEEWRLQDDEKQISRQINERYQVHDPVEDMLVQLYEMDPLHLEWVTTTNNILETLHQMGWRLPTPRAEAMVVATALKTMPVVKPASKITDPVSKQQVRGYWGMRRRINGVSNE
jgi:predicted P-loop ATPase